jgi:hypothetical protein
MKNVMRLDFSTKICNSDGDLIEGTGRYVSILWNETVISTDEVYELINNDMYEYDSRVIVTTPTRANNLRTKKENE